MPAMGIAWFARRLTLLPFGKERWRYLSDLDAISSPYGRGGCLGVIVTIVTVTSVIFVLMNASAYAAFYKDGIRLPSRASYFSSDNYAYSDVEKLVCADGYYDIYGKFVESRQYFIVLKNGRKYPLSDEATSKIVEEKIIPVLEGAGIPLRSAHDAADLDFE